MINAIFLWTVFVSALFVFYLFHKFKETEFIANLFSVRSAAKYTMTLSFQFKNLKKKPNLPSIKTKKSFRIQNISLWESLYIFKNHLEIYLEYVFVGE